jgi:hypothetical protein
MTQPLVPHPGDRFWAMDHTHKLASVLRIAEVEGLRTNGQVTPDYLVRATHGSRWRLTLNHAEALDGIVWRGTPLNADPNLDDL